MEKKGPNSVLMNKYELGRLLGQGTFAKVYHARSIATGEAVAVKVIDKEKVTHARMIEQIKREISVMRLIRHPNVVLLHEVMASRAKIYFVMEYVRGGELFTKITSTGRIKEAAARRYFQELVGAVDFCHSRGVYHRDLKPENLLLDENGRLKISDFGLSALPRSRRQDGLLHTMCGTPAYVAPEVINRRGYDGAKADIWSCGVILFVLLAGYLPFHDSNLMEMYRKITRGDFKCPAWFPSDVRKLLARLLDPNPATRISICKIMENAWFKKEFRPVVVSTHGGDVGGERGEEEASPASIFMEEEQSSGPMKVSWMNAFDIISQSPGFDLSSLFHDGKEVRWPEARRFTTKKPAAAIVSKLEEIADQSEKFKVEKQDGVVKLQGSKEGRKGQLAIDAEIFEVAPSFFMVEMRKKAGDTMEYDKFCKQELKPCLEDIVWTWQGGEEQVQNPQAQSPPP